MRLFLIQFIQNYLNQTNQTRVHHTGKTHVIQESGVLAEITRNEHKQAAGLCWHLVEKAVEEPFTRLRKEHVLVISIYTFYHTPLKRRQVTSIWGNST